jgi:hypothetical protein
MVGGGSLGLYLHRRPLFAIPVGYSMFFSWRYFSTGFSDFGGMEYSKVTGADWKGPERTGADIFVSNCA